MILETTTGGGSIIEEDRSHHNRMLYPSLSESASCTSFDRSTMPSMPSPKLSMKALGEQDVRRGGR